MAKNPEAEVRFEADDALAELVAPSADRIYFAFLGDPDRHYIHGLPASDITGAVWAGLTADQQAAIWASDLYAPTDDAPDAPESPPADEPGDEA